MRGKHSGWSARQLRCLLYWQSHVAKEQRLSIEDFRRDKPETVYSQIPEAMNINVITSLLKSGIDIEVKPRIKVLKIALIGYPNPDFLPSLDFEYECWLKEPRDNPKGLFSLAGGSHWLRSYNRDHTKEMRERRRTCEQVALMSEPCLV